MPRPNQRRTIAGELALARRMAYERDAREWTNEGLAKRMADVGCPIQVSALYKIERGNPPRRVTVNELVALAQVFGLGLGEMLVPPEALVDADTKRSWLELTEASDAYGEAMIRVGNAHGALVDHAKKHPDAAERIYLLLDEFVAGGGWLPMDVAGVRAQVAEYAPGREHVGQDWLDAHPDPMPAGDPQLVAQQRADLKQAAEQLGLTPSATEAAPKATKRKRAGRG